MSNRDHSSLKQQVQCVSGDPRESCCKQSPVKISETELVLRKMFRISSWIDIGLKQSHEVHT